VVSADSGVPLLRYHIADKGGIFEYDELLERCGIWRRSADRIGRIRRSAVAFVYLFGRADFTVSYFAPRLSENISVGLEQPDIRNW